MTDLKYPNMREELLAYLRLLGDVRRQQEVWTDKSTHKPTVAASEFTEAVHFLFDDTRLATKPARTIGILLRSDQEAAAVSLVTRSIDRLFNLYGTNLTVSSYLSLPEWNDVAKASQAAVTLMEGGQ